MIAATYDAERGRLAYHHDSYQGGERYRVPSSTTIGTCSLTRWVERQTDTGSEWEEKVTDRYASYLVPHPGEPKTQFEVRLSLAAYVNVIAPIVDAYVDAVTGPVVRSLGQLEQYLRRLDGEEQGWAECMEECGRWAVVYGMVALLLDVPRENPASNRAEEEQMGVGLRASVVHPTAWAWVEVDDRGVSEFAFVDQPYAADDVGAATQTVNLWRYTRETWEQHEVTVQTSQPIAKACKGAMSEETLRDGGALPRPGKVPVQFAYFRRNSSPRAPSGLSLISDACDLARQVYNTLSWIEEIHRKTAFPFLAIPERAAGGQLDAGTKIQVGPSTALGYNAETGAPSWVQPSAESTRELREHAVFLVGLALRTTGLEVTAEQGSPNQSGVALKIRSRDFDARCTKFARSMGTFERGALRLAAELLGLPGEKVEVTYPKRFVLPDSAEDLARAVMFVQTFGDSLGVEGAAAVMRQALDAALALDDRQLSALVEEYRQKARALIAKADALTKPPQKPTTTQPEQVAA